MRHVLSPTALHGSAAEESESSPVGYSTALQGIINTLEVEKRLAPEPLSVAALGRALGGRLTLDDVAPWIRFDTANYRRNLIARREGWELRLLCWQPGQSTTLHGHGPASCAFRILRGNAGETVLGGRDRVWAPGATVEESTPLVHQVSNVGPDPLLTLHAYSPPLPVESPSSREGHSIVIVGGGFAGVAAAYHLLKAGAADLRILLVERGPWLGRGVAYSVESDVYRLNVPASRMSIDPSQPNDFVNWTGVGATPHVFLPRARYGDYVEDRLGQAIRSARGRLRVIRSDVVAVDAEGVRLANGQRLDAKAVILATGLAARVTPSWLAADDPRIIDAWDECALATAPKEGRILILGSGLSALDVIATFAARGFRGQVTVLSRHGLLPRAHPTPYAPAQPLPADVIDRAPPTLRELVPWARALVRQAEAEGLPWQQGFDALRPHARHLWQRLSANDRARFMRWVRPYWDVLRHRAPEDMLALVTEGREKGAITLDRGRVISCKPTHAGLTVAIHGRDGRRRHDCFDMIVRCLGPALDQADMNVPLLASLLTTGTAMRDPTGLGIVTDAEGALVDAAGHSSTQIFALGALRRAMDWESTAVPEIAQQALALSRHLLLG